MHAAPSVVGPDIAVGATWKRKRRPLAVAGIAVGALAVVGLVLGITSVWNADAALKNQASQVGEESGGVVEARSVFEPGLGASAGNLAGGGIALPEGDALYLAKDEGVFYLEAVSSEENAVLQGIVTDRASNLNSYDNALYYLAASSGADLEPGSGTSIRRVEDPLRSPGKARSPEVLFRAESGTVLASLVVHDGWMYFTVEDKKGWSLMEMPCDASSAPHELKRYNVECCWAFVESDSLYVVTSTSLSWAVEQCKLDDADQGSFTSFLTGDGRLRASCFHQGALYYTLEGAADAEPLRMKDAKGGFKEYPEAVGGVRLAASGEVVAVLGETGSLQWVDVTAGFVHDESWMVDEGLGGSDPSTVGLGLYDEWLCMRNNEGDYLQLNINNGDIWAGGPSADRLSDAVEAGADEPAILV